MRLTTILVAFLAAAAAVAVQACDDTQQVRLSSGFIPAGRVSLLRITGGDKIRACVEVNAGRRIDWYFTTTAAARAWMTNANAYYATPRTVPYPQPPAVFYQSRIGTSGFSFDFDVSSEQADAASEDFSVILHSTADCLGTGNECVVGYSVHLIKPLAVWAIVIIVICCIAICVSIAGCVYCCCCRNRNQQPVEPNGTQMAPAQGVVVGQGQQPAGYPAQPQPAGYPAQAGGYPAQAGGYPAQAGGYPAQQQHGAYPPPQQPGQYPPQQQGQQYPAQHNAGYSHHQQQGFHQQQQPGYDGYNQQQQYNHQEQQQHQPDYQQDRNMVSGLADDGPHKTVDEPAPAPEPEAAGGNDEGGGGNDE